MKLAVCDVNMDRDLLRGVELRLRPTLLRTLSSFSIVSAFDAVDASDREGDDAVVGVLAPSTRTDNSASAKTLAQMCKCSVERVC